jgi:hypothetical protein
MAVSVSKSASLSITGVTPTVGTGFTLLANPSLSATNVVEQDYFANVFTVNPSTVAQPDTDQSMGEITEGHVIWIQTDQPVTVTLTQAGPVDNAFLVDSFLYMNCTFTALQIANASATTAANINIIVAGDRITNPSTPGIYKVA